MRFCEKCKETKPFTIDSVQPICDECTAAWIDVHSKSGKKTEEHKNLVYDHQKGWCAMCDALVDSINKMVFHEDENNRYSALCSTCAGRFRLVGYDVSLMDGLVRQIGFYNAHNEPMSVKDKKWLSVCVNSGPLFSTCCKGQYFAVVVSKDGKLLSEGWNGVPSGEVHCNQGGCERAMVMAEANSSYMNCMAQHAEINAIQNVAKEDLKGSTLYVNGTPCHECVRAIVHSGISRVVFIPQEKYDYPNTVSTLGMYGVSAVYIEDEDVLMQKGTDIAKSIRSTYKTNADLVNDLPHAKKMLSYLRFNRTMDRVARCQQAK